MNKNELLRKNILRQNAGLDNGCVRMIFDEILFEGGMPEELHLHSRITDPEVYSLLISSRGLLHQTYSMNGLSDSEKSDTGLQNALTVGISDLISGLRSGRYHAAMIGFEETNEVNDGEHMVGLRGENGQLVLYDPINWNNDPDSFRRVIDEGEACRLINEGWKHGEIIATWRMRIKDKILTKLRLKK